MVSEQEIIMADKEEKIELMESQFPAASGPAFAAAREKALAFGLSVLQSEQGYIYEVFPDGHRVVVKQIEPPTLVAPGSKITMW
jgi:hypothetical protein